MNGRVLIDDVMSGVANRSAYTCTHFDSSGLLQLSIIQPHEEQYFEVIDNSEPGR